MMIKARYKRLIVCLLFILAGPFPVTAVGPWEAHGPLRVTEDGHRVQHEDGTPFFFMADTAWKLRSLSKAEIDVYLSDRAAKEFNVVMASFMGDRDQAFTGARPYAQVQLAEAWWAHNDYIVDKAAENGLYVVVIAGWGNHFQQLFADMPQGMYEYGRILGRRYRDKPNVIYFVSAEFYKIRRRYDGKPLSADQQHWFNQLGRGIRSVDKTHPISIHGFPNRGPVGQPSTYFQKESWCDFYAVQTHNFQETIRPTLSHDWDLTNPTKPTVNAEAGYENMNKQLHPWIRKHAAVALFDSGWGQRFQAYWSVFFGGFGFAYGNDYLWEMTDPQDADGVLYRPALDAPGARSMKYLRRLMQLRINSAVPDQSLITSPLGTDEGGDSTVPPDLCCALRDREGQWALVYTTLGKDFTLDLARLKVKRLRARWYNPRNGTYQEAGSYGATGHQAFDPPGQPGKAGDWILVLQVPNLMP